MRRVCHRPFRVTIFDHNCSAGENVRQGKTWRSPARTVLLGLVLICGAAALHADKAQEGTYAGVINALSPAFDMAGSHSAFDEEALKSLHATNAGGIVLSATPTLQAELMPTVSLSVAALAGTFLSDRYFQHSPYVGGQGRVTVRL